MKITVLLQQNLFYTTWKRYHKLNVISKHGSHGTKYHGKIQNPNHNYIRFNKKRCKGNPFRTMVSAELLTTKKNK